MLTAKSETYTNHTQKYSSNSSTRAHVNKISWIRGIMTGRQTHKPDDIHHEQVVSMVSTKKMKAKR